MTRVSIAMATYNGARFVREQMESLLSQTRPPDEIVVCDDASTDETLDLVRNVQITSSVPIHVVRNSENRGYIANFLAAASRCSGDLIQFCDQDDIWANTKIAACIGPFASAETMLVFHNADVFHEDGSERRLYLAPPRAKGVHTGADVQFAPLGFTLTFRRELLAWLDLHTLSRDPNAVDRPEAHDQWMYFLANAFGRTVYLDSPLARYRQHASNVSGWGHKAGLKLLRHNLKEAANRQAGIEACAGARRHILEQTRGFSAESEQTRQRSLAIYTQIIRTTSARRQIYCAGSIPSRLASFADLATAALKSDEVMQQIGFRGLVKDAVLGPLFGGMLSRGAALPGRPKL